MIDSVGPRVWTRFPFGHNVKYKGMAGLGRLGDGRSLALRPQPQVDEPCFKKEHNEFLGRIHVATSRLRLPLEMVGNSVLIID